LWNHPLALLQMQLVHLSGSCYALGMSSTYLWLDGVLHPADQPHLPASIPGILLGNGVFETLVWKDGPQFIKRHWLRLNTGLDRLKLPQVSFQEMDTALRQLYEANPETHKRLRFTVLASTNDRAHLVATCSPLREWPQAESLIVSPWPQVTQGPLTGIKSTSYAANHHIHQWATEKGYGDAILFNSSGHLAETTGANLFIIQADGRVLTPPLSSGCLPGVTREIVLEAMPPFQQRDITVTELDHAHEVFMTSSTRGVQAVGRIGERSLSHVDGHITQSARTALEKALS
jgi:branched-chain amino acid aminotransferase